MINQYRLKSVVPTILVIAGLYLTSLYSYLLFHSLVEIFSIVIAFSIFILAWNSRKYLENHFLLLIGIAYLFIGLVDLIHTLGYTGLGIFQGYDSDLPTQLWIAARYLEAFSILTACLFIGNLRLTRPNRLIFIYSVIVFLLFSSIFYWNIFPACYVEGHGLTSYKIISEYIITCLLLSSLCLIYIKRTKFEKDVLVLISISILLTIGSELAFTFYISVYGFSNLVGHFFKLLSFYVIYIAIIERGINRPFSIIFRELKKSETMLNEAKSSLEEKVINRTKGLEASNQQLMASEQQLKESEKKFRNYIEKSPDSVFVVDNNGRYLEVNNAAIRITGFSEKELINMSINDLICEESLEAGMGHFKKLMETGAATSDLWHKCKDGSKVCLTVAAVILSKTQALGFGKDITDTKEYERKIEELSRFPEENNNPVMRVSVEGIIMYANKPAAAIISLQELKVGDSFPEDWMLLLKAIKDKNAPQTIERETADGRIFRWNYTFIEESGYVNIYGSDITEIRQAEKEKELLQQQLIQSQKMEAMGVLAGGVAHDFNNILTGILGGTDLLIADETMDTKFKTDLECIKTSTKRAAELVKQLLIFSRQEMISMEPLDINNSIHEQIKMLKRIIGEQIKVQLDVPEEKFIINGNKGNIAQVIINLAINARDAMPAGGKLTISTKRCSLTKEDTMYLNNIEPGEYVMLIVEDTGFGMSKEIKDRIFEPFFTSKGVGKGTGLGLPVVLGIVQSHNGGIDVSSEVGKGTVFNMYFPLTPSGSIVKKKKKKKKTLEGNGEKILVIEDGVSIQGVIKKIFEYTNYKGVFAGSLSEAEAEYRKDPDSIDLVLSDMVLPDGTGIEAIKKLNKIKPIKKLIFASGYLDDQSRWKEIQKDKIPFLQKPFSMDELLEILRETLK